MLNAYNQIQNINKVLSRDERLLYSSDSLTTLRNKLKELYQELKSEKLANNSKVSKEKRKTYLQAIGRANWEIRARTAVTNKSIDQLLEGEGIGNRADDIRRYILENDEIDPISEIKNRITQYRLDSTNAYLKKNRRARKAFDCLDQFLESEYSAAPIDTPTQAEEKQTNQTTESEIQYAHQNKLAELDYFALTQYFSIPLDQPNNSSEKKQDDKKQLAAKKQSDTKKQSDSKPNTKPIVLKKPPALELIAQAEPNLSDLNQDINPEDKKYPVAQNTPSHLESKPTNRRAYLLGAAAVALIAAVGFTSTNSSKVEIQDIAPAQKYHQTQSKPKEQTKIDPTIRFVFPPQIITSLDSDYAPASSFVELEPLKKITPNMPPTYLDNITNAARFPTQPANSVFKTAFHPSKSKPEQPRATPPKHPGFPTIKKLTAQEKTSLKIKPIQHNIRKRERPVKTKSFKSRMGRTNSRRT